MILSEQLLAQAQQSGGGGTAWFLPVMLVVMVLLLWLPMRRQKKAQAQIKAKQATMEPGTRVMTSSLSACWWSASRVYDTGNREKRSRSVTV